MGLNADYGRIKEEIPYKAFSGANIYATVGNRRIASLQGLTVSITREVAAMYGFGDANPKAFVKGKRGIAGTLVFSQFDRHALLGDLFRDVFHKTLGDAAGLFGSRGGDLGLDNSLPTSNFDNSGGGAAVVREALDRQFGANGVDDDLAAQMSTVYDMVRNQQFQYADQIPEFDIVLTLMNESGDAAFTMLSGVTIVNEGWGYSLDDLTSETAYTYVCRAITPLTSLSNKALWGEGHKPYSFR